MTGHLMSGSDWFQNRRFPPADIFCLTASVAENTSFNLSGGTLCLPFKHINVLIRVIINRKYGT